MLRIHFTSEDLTRLRVATGPDPMWELVLSLHLLQNRQAALVFDPWRREVRAGLARAGLTDTVADLARLCPFATYFPDFLTPGQGVTELETGIDRVLSTPVPRLSAEVSQLYGPGRMPAGARRLAGGDRVALGRLGDALRRYYAVAVAPYAAEIGAAVAADRPVRAQAALDRGSDGLLATYQPDLTWRDENRVLEAPYPVASEKWLDGRALTLIPAFFCVRHPVALADPGLDQVLVHPLTPRPGWLERAGADRGERGEAVRPAVAQLVGHTRAAVLEVLERPLSTTQLGSVLRLALSTASRHASVLREAGLVVSERCGPSVVHRRTALGDALMNGAYPAPPARACSAPAGGAHRREARAAVPAGRVSGGVW
ncbi:ArsR/SmtB family transcription factor [Streptomyces sp. NPDC057682]|uniref:ArsR/SmtB family transcription factor n=1 Tax=Streptomyces sp. NPDC057682 TaxID=3346210 RepID=UPI0036B525CF